MHIVYGSRIFHCLSSDYSVVLLNKNNHQCVMHNGCSNLKGEKFPFIFCNKFNFKKRCYLELFASFSAWFEHMPKFTDA